MKKRQADHKSSRPATADFLKKRPAFWVFLCCVLTGCCVAVSAPMLGDILGRFLVEESHVIALAPPEETRLKSGEAEGSLRSAAGAERTEKEKTAAADRTVLNRNAAGVTRYTAGESDSSHRGLLVYDDTQAWDSETYIELFRSSYDGTVKSGDGEKVIAPGTSNYYNFTVKNNGKNPLDYTISLEIETYLGEQEDCSEIPVEWRLLSGDGAAVSGWKGCNERTEVLKKDALAVRHQDNYTIEWRWLFERGGDMDEADTRLGNMAVEQALGVTAVIYVQAEQSADVAKVDGDKEKNETPSGSGGMPQTGDTSNILLYLELLAASACVLLILATARRRRKRDEDMQNDRK